MTDDRRPRWLWWLVIAISAVTAAIVSLLGRVRGHAERLRPGPVAPTTGVPSTGAPSSAAPSGVAPNPVPSAVPGGSTAPHAEHAEHAPGCHPACGHSCDPSRVCDQLLQQACDQPLSTCDHATTCHLNACGSIQIHLLGAWLLAAPGPPRTRVTLPARAGLLAIRGYQRWISARLGTHCRYTPSCSNYGADALRTFGALTGSRLALARIRRCTAEVPCGTSDPISRVAESARIGWTGVVETGAPRP